MEKEAERSALIQVEFPSLNSNVTARTNPKQTHTFIDIKHTKKYLPCNIKPSNIKPKNTKFHVVNKQLFTTRGFGILWYQWLYFFVLIHALWFIPVENWALLCYFISHIISYVFFHSLCLPLRSLSWQSVILLILDSYWLYLKKTYLLLGRGN